SSKRLLNRREEIIRRWRSRPNVVLSHPSWILVPTTGRAGGDVEMTILGTAGRTLAVAHAATFRVAKERVSGVRAARR
ncbi:MAG: hypothetical protein LC808_15140, partial [Actinobacteria bacterium]|nr:hypothetical protein [Actinomycetota bacterium]